MSGTALAPWASARKPAVEARRLAWLLECPMEPSADLVECMRKQDAEVFVESALKFLEWDIDPLLVFSPSVEPEHDGLRLLPAPALQLVREAERHGDVDLVPWMTGLTFDDGSMRSAVIYPNVKLVEELESDWERIAPITLRFKDSAGDVAWAAGRVHWFYFDKHKVQEAPVSQLTLMYTDRHFFAPMVESMHAMLNAGSDRPLFLYRFNHRGLHSITARLDPNSDTDYGVCHLDDLQYIFSMPEYFPAVPEDPKHPDHQMMLQMTSLFADYARTGHPTPAGEEKPPSEMKFNDTEHKEPFKWLPVKPGPLGTVQDLAELHVDRPSYMSYTSMWAHRTEFWYDLGFAENGRPPTTTTTTPAPSTEQQEGDTPTPLPDHEENKPDQIPVPPTQKVEL